MIYVQYFTIYFGGFYINYKYFFGVEQYLRKNRTHRNDTYSSSRPHPNNATSILGDPRVLGQQYDLLKVSSISIRWHFVEAPRKWDRWTFFYVCCSLHSILFFSFSDSRPRPKNSIFLFRNPWGGATNGLLKVFSTSIRCYFLKTPPEAGGKTKRSGRRTEKMRGCSSVWAKRRTVGVFRAPCT